MATAFTFETVDDGNSIPVHGEVSLALDKQGNPRVAYGLVTGQVVLARRDNGVWTREPLPGGSNIVSLDNGPLSLAIDSQGNPHIAFRHMTGVLIHAVKNGAQWTVTPVETNLTPLGGTSGISSLALAIDPGRQIPELRDVAYVGYSDQASLGAGYSSLGTGPASRVTVEASTQTIGEPSPSHTAAVSMAFGPLDESLVMAYVLIDQPNGSSTRNTVRMRRIIDIKRGTVGPAIAVEGSTSLNVLATSIAMTSTETCLVYFDLAGHQLKAFISLNQPPATDITVVDSNVHVSIAPSLAQNRGQFRVAYASDAVKLASRSNPGDWSVEIVDPAAGSAPSLAYDNFGNAHIAYAAGGKLKYAKRAE